MFNFQRHILNIAGIGLFVGILASPVFFSLNFLKVSEPKNLPTLGVNFVKRSLSLQIETTNLDLNSDIKVKYYTYPNELILYDKFIEIENKKDQPVSITVVTEKASPEIFFGKEGQISGPKIVKVEPYGKRYLNLVAKPNIQNTQVEEINFRLVTL